MSTSKMLMLVEVRPDKRAAAGGRWFRARYYGCTKDIAKAHEYEAGGLPCVSEAEAVAVPADVARATHYLVDGVADLMQVGVEDRTALHAVLGGDVGAPLKRAFGWASTPHGYVHWADRLCGRVSLTDSDRAFLRALVIREEVIAARAPTPALTVEAAPTPVAEAAPAVESEWVDVPLAVGGTATVRRSSACAVWRGGDGRVRLLLSGGEAMVLRCSLDEVKRLLGVP